MKWGVILLLSRFHNKLFSSYQYLMEQMSNYLETQPEREATLSSVREHLLLVMEEKCLNQRKIKKFYELLQTTGLTKFYTRPHTEVYGHFAEDRHKVGVERQVRVVKLLKTYKEHMQELEDNEQAEPELLLTDNQMTAEQPWLMQIYRFMRTGVSKIEISKSLQLTVLEVQRYINKLVKDKQIDTYFHSEGKLKYRRYVAVNQEPNLSQSEKAVRQEIQELKLPNFDLQSNTASTSDVPVIKAEVETITPEKKTELNVCGTRMSIKENRRRKIILKELEQSKVVNGTHCLRKLIMKQEKEDGHSEICAAKTMPRLIKGLKRDGLLNVIHTVVPTTDENGPKQLMLITVPGLPENDELVHNVIKATQFKASNQKTKLHKTVYRAQQKKKRANRLKKIMKNFSGQSEDEEKVTKKASAKTATVKEEVPSYVDVRTGQPSSSDQQSQGYMRKMARSRIMYTYIWYLLYGHPQRSESNMLDVDDLGLIKTRCKRTQPSPAKYGQNFKANVNQSQKLIPNTNATGPPATNEISELMNMVEESSGMQCSEPSTSSEVLANAALDEENLVNNLKVYCDEMSWKRFLPPLPRYTKCAEGWFYVTDVIMIMPLTIFCSLIMLSVKIHNLHDYLNDPYKKYIPLMFLPEELQQHLCYRRKYIHSFHQGLQRMCQMGLLTFGPSEDFFDKDQVFCYLHKKGTIVDTTSCKKHYNIVNPGHYPVKHYTRNSEAVVNQFFRDLQVICLNTPLGLSRRDRTLGLPKNSLEEKMMIKELVLDVDDISVVPEDTGKLPGNGQGAAGLDSRIYAHLRKNWSLPPPPMQSTSKKYKSRQKMKIDMLKARKNRHKALGKKSVLKALNVTISENQKGRHEKVKGGRGLKRPKPPAETAPKKKLVKKVKSKPEEKQLVCIGPRSKMILKRNRFDWNQEEDELMMMFQVVTLLLAKKRAGFFIPWCFRQELMHKYIPSSENKNTNGVMRRSQYLLKSQAFCILVAKHLAQLENDEVISEALKKKIDYRSNEACEREYAELLELTIQRLRIEPEIEQFPSTLEKFHDMYDTFITPEMLRLLPRYKIPRQVKWTSTDLEEIKKLVLRQAVMASFFLIDRPVLFNPTQAFYVFNQFKEDFLLEVVEAIKDAYLTTRNRFRRRIRRVLPCTAMSLQVSGTCRKTFDSTITSRVVKEAYEYMQSLDENQYGKTTPFNVPIAATCGQVACFISMLSCNLVTYTIQVPDQVILLDSSFINKATLERTAKLMGNAEESSDESDGDEDVDPQQGQKEEQQTTSKQQCGPAEDETQGSYPMYKRMTRIQKISHAFEEKQMDQRTAAQEEEPAADNQEQNQVNATFVNTEHSYTQMMPTISEKPVASEDAAPLIAPKNSGTSAEKDLRKLRQDPRVCSTRTDWFLLQGLTDEGTSDDGSGMLDAIMLKPCQIEIKLSTLLQENMHHCNKNTSLPPDDHQVFDNTDEMNLYSLKEDFLIIEQRGEVKEEWTTLEQFESTKFIPIPLMKKNLIKDIIPTLSKEESTLFHLISNNCYLGLTAPEIITSEHHLDVNGLIENLHKLMKKKLIFRVGLDVHRYVAVHYCDFWSISSAQYTSITSSDGPTPKVRRKLTKEMNSSEEVIVEEVVSMEMEKTYVPANDEKKDEGVKVTTDGTISTNENIQNDEAVEVTTETLINVADEFQTDNSKEPDVVVQEANCKIPTSNINSTTYLNSNSDLKIQNQVFNGDNPGGTLKPYSENSKDKREPSPPTNVSNFVGNKSFGSSSLQNKMLNDLIQETVPKRKTRKRKVDFDPILSADMILTKETQKIQFIPRQWYNLGGEVEMDELVRLLQKLALIVVSKPGIPEKDIIKQLHLVLSPVECKEILQMLLQAGCITKHLIPKLPSPFPFSNQSNSNESVHEYYFIPTTDCLLRIAAYERYKTVTDTEPAENQDVNQSSIETAVK
ncbi:general transcription factor 3C polypeptide 1-like [Anneissia japonica]|uniref:general transcription factor 3C polypeptide 1-like n=1 Tax=Anneissia japonica TaxID=1529436 RepID=UPI0014259C39|nr:general transcription factor 3C polypeptide 1-like [Anneissia japonica]